MPRRCPSIAGSPRSLAQRRLPSIMMATWRGTEPEPSATAQPSANDIVMPADTIRSRPQRPPSGLRLFSSEGRARLRIPATRREERGRAIAGRDRAARAAPAPPQRVSAPRSHFHDLFFFGRDEAVDLFDVLVRKLLKGILHPLVLVFRDR